MYRIGLLIFLGANLALVIVGAFRLPFAKVPVVGVAASEWGLVTGTSSSFGFFCSVPDELRPRFFIIRESGVHEEVELFHGGAMSREAELRFLGTVGVFKDVPDSVGRERLIQSWVAFLFMRHPDVRAIEVRLELLEIPTPAELAQGKRPAWQLAEVVRVARPITKQGPR